jgi:hypothetical protein
MKMKLEIQDRKSGTGKKLIAPYINDWCVWDIPAKEWTPAVQAAVAHAYQIGVQHTITEMYIRLEAPSCNANDIWEKRV